jgi:hypothetical protein
MPVKSKICGKQLRKESTIRGYAAPFIGKLQGPKLSGILKNLQNPVELHLDVF